ncbi:hypothetical protein [Streptosporangium sp. NPDC000396]|uniref:hypothetical protein n=1 Tax=Streptosporangium sp. NPDC000396 TaxID=3366185 RepID=UPI0036AFD41E
MEFSRQRPPLEFLLSGGFVVTVMACVSVAVLVPEGAPSIVAMTVVAGAFAVWSRNLLASSVTALMVWLFTTGFLVNTAGELTLNRPDALRLGVFAAAALLGHVSGSLRTRLRRKRRLMRARSHPRRPPVLLGRLHQRQRV